MPSFYGTLDTTFEEKRTSVPAGLQGLAQGNSLRGVPRRRPAAFHPRERRSVLIDCIRKDLGFRASRQNLWLVPLSTSYLGEASRQGFILGWSKWSFGICENGY
jgi:hypothetical protein